MRKTILRNCGVFGIALLLTCVALPLPVNNAEKSENVVLEMADVEFDTNNNLDDVSQIIESLFIDWDSKEVSESSEIASEPLHDKVSSKDERVVDTCLALWFFYDASCGYCDLQVPVIDEVERVYAGRVVVTRINIDADRELAEVYDISLTPTILIDFSSNTIGILSDRLVGYRDLEMLMDIIDAKLGIQKIIEEPSEPSNTKEYIAPRLSESTFEDNVADSDVSVTSDFVDISVAEAWEMIAMKSGELDSPVIIDVRTYDEYVAGYIEGALLISLAELQGNIGSRAASLEDSLSCIVYSDTGGRSYEACRILVDYGFSHVYNMIGGLDAWIAAGYDVATFEDLALDVFTIDNKTTLLEPVEEAGCSDTTFPSDTNLSSYPTPITTGTTGGPCTENGCGPGSWKLNIMEAGAVAAALAAMFGFAGIAALFAFVSIYAAVFDDNCVLHDYCYCAGESTYCYSRKDCDVHMRDRNYQTCEDVFLTPIDEGLCKTAADIFYEGTRSSGGEESWAERKDICYDYLDWETTKGPEYACPGILYTVYADSSYTGCPRRGTSAFPFQDLNDAIDTVEWGGTLRLTGDFPGSYIIDKHVTLVADSGSVVIG